jgi:hypothetical protein
MDGGGHETHPLPTDPALAQAAEAVQRAGHWAWIVDDRWNVVFVSDESRVTFGGGTTIDVPLGRFFFGPELVSASTGWATG